MPLPNAKQTLRTHHSEFPEVKIDTEAKALKDMGFSDESWHNDAGPRFQMLMRYGELSGMWVSVTVVENSELAPNDTRERVWYIFVTNEEDTPLGDATLETEDFIEVLRWIQVKKQVKAPVQRRVEWADQQDAHRYNIEALKALGFAETTEPSDRYMNVAKPLVHGLSQVVVQFIEPGNSQHTMLVQIWQMNRLEATMTWPCSSIGEVLKQVSLLLACATTK